MQRVPCPRPPFRSRSLSLLAAAAATAATIAAASGLACDRVSGGRGHAAGDIGGTVVIAVTHDPESLFPPTVNTSGTMEVVDQLFETLARLGDGLNTIGDRGMVPALADRWQWATDSLSIAFHIDSRARWHDGVPVHASDVRYTFGVYRDTAVGSPVATDLAEIDSVTVRDSLTVVVWFAHRYPLQFHDAATEMYVLPSHLLAATRPSELRTSLFGIHPVGTGRFRMARWVRGQSLQITADTGNYHGRPRLDNVMWLVTPNYQSGLGRLNSGDADVVEIVHPEDLPDLAHRSTVRLVGYEDPTYAFIAFNLHDPLFANRALRRATAMGLDRDRMLRNVFDTFATVPKGPFFHWNQMADTSLTPVAYDTVAAQHTLDSLGWRPGHDGVRSRHGQELAFTLLTPSSSKPRMQYAVLIQEQLRQLGMVVTIETMDMPALLRRMETHQFDAYIGAWKGDPTANGTKQTWTTAAAREGRNYGFYENAAFDALVDSGLDEARLPRAREYFRRAYTIIDGDVPGVWLYEPRQVAAIQRRIHPAALRPDAWWAKLADWSIPAADRISRDRLGVASAAPTVLTSVSACGEPRSEANIPGGPAARCPAP